MDDTGELAFREENVKAHGIKLRSKLPVLKWKIKKDESTAQNASGTIPVQRNRGTTLRIARNSFKRLRSMGKQQSISSLGEDDEEDDTETADETGVAAAPRPRRSFRASFNKRAPPRLTLGNASSQGRGVPTASSQQGSPAGSPEGSVRTHGERGDNQYSGGDDDGGGDANANIHDDKNSGGHNVSGKDETKVDQIERGGGDELEARVRSGSQVRRSLVTARQDSALLQKPLARKVAPTATATATSLEPITPQGLKRSPMLEPSEPKELVSTHNNANANAQPSDTAMSAQSIAAQPASTKARGSIDLSAIAGTFAYDLLSVIIRRKACDEGIHFEATLDDIVSCASELKKRSYTPPHADGTVFDLVIFVLFVLFAPICSLPTRVRQIFFGWFGADAAWQTLHTLGLVEHLSVGEERKRHPACCLSEWGA